MGQVVLIILQDNFFQRQTFICANPTNVYVEDNVSHSTKAFIKHFGYAKNLSL